MDSLLIALLFQSLIGFKINWNGDYVIVRTVTTAFQSLIGFKINWNLVFSPHLKVSPITVSIPNRV